MHITLNFSEDENILLKNHIKKTFNINMKLKKRKDGKNFLLGINKRDEIIKFINIVKPFVLYRKFHVCIIKLSY